VVDIVLSSIQLLIALFLVVLNGFFVAAEFAFVRIRKTSVKQLVEDGKPGSAVLDEVMDKLDNYLAVTQLGITIASLGLGWVGEPAVAALIEPVLEPVLSESLLHLVAFALGFSTITFLHVVFGELAPKTIAIAEAERLALFVAPPMKLFYLLFYPGLVVFNGTANAFTRLIGVPPASETEETLEEREIRRVLARSGEEGHVEMAEVEMIERVFDLDDTTMMEVMVPRPDVATVSADAPVGDLRETVFEAEHTRYPVVEPDDSDQIVGFIDVKDILRAEVEDEATTAGDLARDVIIVPETKAVSDLLVQFRDQRQQMAAVIDEWGALEGIATQEDVVEAIVGDLRDEFDDASGEATIRKEDDGRYLVDGSVPLATLNDTLGTQFDGDGFETVGGLVLDHLGRAPETGDTVTESDCVFEVSSVDGTRVSAVRIDAAEETRSDSE
jgi:CBS domain containing-hemolysin-like protein